MKTKANRHIKMDYARYLNKCCYWNDYDFIPIKRKRWYKTVEYKGYKASSILWYGSMASVEFGDIEGKAYALWIQKIGGAVCLHAGNSNRMTKGQLKKSIDMYLKMVEVIKNE